MISWLPLLTGKGGSAKLAFPMGAHLTLLRTVANTRPLYFNKGVLYCARLNQIFSTSDYGQSFSLVCRLNLSPRVLNIVSRGRLMSRIFRSVVYRMRVLANGNMVFIFRGGIYTLPAGSQTADRTFRILRGSRPVSLACDPEGLVVFGEYWNNASREAVHVYGSRDFGQIWQPVYTFAPGSVQHIHGLTFDLWDQCFWLCTGDRGPECRLLRADRDFRTVEVVRQHGQMNRFYSVHAGRDYLILPTDSAREQNCIFIYNKKTGALTKQQSIENACFYHGEAGGRIFLSTTAEPCALNDDQFSHVWMGTATGDSWRRVLSFPVDSWSRLTRNVRMLQGLFQYPRVFFPEGHNPGNVLVCFGVGLNGADNTMLCYDISDLG